VVLTNVSPFGGGRGYLAAAAETTTGTTRNWELEVQVTCANPMPGYQIVTGTSEQPTTSALQIAIARCPSTKRVTGTGAAIRLVGSPFPVADEGLVLQTVRASGPGDITRAQAREAPGGYVDHVSPTARGATRSFTRSWITSGVPTDHPSADRRCKRPDCRAG
jgi:hypothetical protein